MTSAPHPAVRPSEGGRAAIIGAGVAGLALAHNLALRGRDVVVFDKGRGVGGRTSSRRHGDLVFDHGAPCFSAKDPRFKSVVDQWIADGVAAQWLARILTVDEAGVEREVTRHDLLVGVPTMSALARSLSQGLTVRCEQRIASISRGDHGWCLVAADGTAHAPFETLVLALPVAQTLGLLAEDDSLASRLDRASLAPCWAVMARYDTPLPFPADGLSLAGGALAWAARDSSKPGRAAGESWVLHATREYTAAHLDVDESTIAASLLDALAQYAGDGARNPAFSIAHRWRYGTSGVGLGTGPLFDANRGLGVCGDWCANSASVESAYLSGLDLAQQIEPV